MQVFLIVEDSTAQTTAAKILKNLGHQTSSFAPADKDFLGKFREVRDKILAADAVVAIVTEAEFRPTHRFEIALAVEQGKPTLVAYAENLKAKIEEIKSDADELTWEAYRDDVQLETILDNFTSATQKRLGAKLFMNIPPSVDKYLKWVATHTDRTKTAVVTEAVEAHAKQNKAYQTFLHETR